MGIKKVAFKPEDFVIVLEYEDGFPMESTSEEGWLVQAVHLPVRRVDTVKGFHECFSDAPETLWNTIYVGKSNGGKLSVVMPLARYLEERIDQDLSVAMVRRIFTTAFHDLWLVARKVRNKLGKSPIGTTEVLIMPKHAVTPEQIDYLFGYPTLVTRRARATV